MRRPLLRRLWCARGGVATVEFALAGTLLVVATTGVIGAGLISWTKNGLLAAASLTARCVALGSPACTGNAAGYAVTLAQQWVFGGIITAENVSVTTATSCNGATGQYTRVAIDSTHWIGSVLPMPQNTMTLSVTACYLSATS